jgi:hypothetical protein
MISTVALSRGYHPVSRASWGQVAGDPLVGDVVLVLLAPRSAVSRGYIHLRPTVKHLLLGSARRLGVVTCSDRGAQSPPHHSP